MAIPVWVSWFTLTFTNGEKERRFVVSTDPIQGRRMVRLGRARWRIEAFFKTIKPTFALRRAGQGTRLGMLRFVLLSLLAFVLVFASRTVPRSEAPIAWGEVAEEAAVLFLPVTLVLALLALLGDLERRRGLLAALGMRVEIRRLRRPAHRCKI